MKHCLPLLADLQPSAPRWKHRSALTAHVDSSMTNKTHKAVNDCCCNGFIVSLCACCNALCLQPAPLFFSQRAILCCLCRAACSLIWIATCTSLSVPGLALLSPHIPLTVTVIREDLSWAGVRLQPLHYIELITKK